MKKAFRCIPSRGFTEDNARRETLDLLFFACEIGPQPLALKLRIC